GGTRDRGPGSGGRLHRSRAATTVVSANRGCGYIRLHLWSRTRESGSRRCVVASFVCGSVFSPTDARGGPGTRVGLDSVAAETAPAVASGQIRRSDLQRSEEHTSELQSREK